MPAKTTITEKGNAEKMLARLPFELRGKSLTRALRKGGTEVAKVARRLAPKPGYEGDKPEFTALNKTIRVKLKMYKNSVVAVTGPSWPQGAHGHLVEFGHEIQRTTPGQTRTRPVPFLRNASDVTKHRQQTAIVNSMKSDIAEIVRAAGGNL